MNKEEAVNAELLNKLRSLVHASATGVEEESLIESLGVTRRVYVSLRDELETSQQTFRRRRRDGKVLICQRATSAKEKQALTNEKRLFVQDVATKLRENGEITRGQIKDLFSLDDDSLTGLLDELLPSIEREAEGKVKRVRKSGTLVLKPKSSRLDGTPASQAPESIPRSADLSPWQQAAVERLTVLLKHEELERLLGTLVRTSRVTRKMITGHDRRGSKEELARALLIQHDRDLFAHKDVREEIARAAGVKNVERWQRGKTSAVEFVKICNFPDEFAGQVASNAAPDIEFIDSVRHIAPLEDFQEEVSQACLKVLDRSEGRALVTLPTGAGKTRVAVSTLARWMMEESAEGRAPRFVIWIAHTEELCEQACQCFLDVWQATAGLPRLCLVRFWGDHASDLAVHRELLAQAKQNWRVLVTTPNRLGNLVSGRTPNGGPLLMQLTSHTACLVVDEAHRAAAPTYRTIVAKFSEGSGAAVLGLTATPYRLEYALDADAGTEDLRDIFDQLISPTKTLGEDPRRALQLRMVLARPVVKRIRTEVRLSVPDDNWGDPLGDVDAERIDRAFAERTDRIGRRLEILGRMVPVARDKSTSMIYFGPTVHDAISMAYMLREHGVNAAFVGGDTHPTVRRAIVDDFRKGALQVVCNCQVFTTGFDAPRVTHVVVARPTVSQVLYEQMVGRGLRGPRFGGTETCEIWDVEDEFAPDVRRPQLGFQGFRRVWGLDVET